MTRKQIKSKVNIDLVLNFLSLGVVAACGILFNVFISILYDAEALGIINQVFALYIVFAQLGTFGLQFSVQKYISSSRGRQEQLEILNASFFSSIIFAIVASFTFYFLAQTVSDIQESSDLYQSIRYASIGLFFYCLNKVILGCMNGLRHMGIFSLLQSIRSLCLILFLFVLYMYGCGKNSLSLVFTYAELTVFCFGLYFLISNRLLKISLVSFKEIKRQVIFGIQGMLSGILIEFNSRVDILMLGYFMSDKQVGVYSIASTIAEGFLLVLVVFRNNFNPLLAKLYSRNKLNSLSCFVRSWKNKIYGLMSIFSLILISAFWIFSNLLDNKEWISSYPFFIILVIGTFVCSGYYPFLSLLLQAGFPALFSLVIVAGVLLNVCFNYILIPMYGVCGAAIATSVANVLCVYFGILLTNKKLNISII